VSRLSKAIGAPGGQTFAQSVTQAQNVLASLTAEGHDHLAASITRVGELARHCSTDAHTAGALVEVVAEIQTVAGTFGKPELSEAAKLFRDFITETAGTDKWSPKAVFIFSDALSSLFRGGEGSPRELVATLQVFASRVLAGAAKL